MSECGGEAENICSHGVLRILTLSGHRARTLVSPAGLASSNSPGLARFSLHDVEHGARRAAAQPANTDLDASVELLRIVRLELPCDAEALLLDVFWLIRTTGLRI